MTASFTFVTNRHVEPVLPVVVMLDNAGHLLSQDRLPITDPFSRRLLEAAVHDLCARCAQLPNIQLYWWCAYPWKALNEMPMPRWTGSISYPMEKAQVTDPLLLVAGDAPTIPRGYLKSAVTALHAGDCAWVIGKTGSMLYLLGWGTGGGMVQLPDWHRFLQTDGLAQLRRDLQKGYAAPAVATVLTQHEYPIVQQQRRWLRLA